MRGCRAKEERQMDSRDSESSPNLVQISPNPPPPIGVVSALFFPSLVHEFSPLHFFQAAAAVRSHICLRIASCRPTRQHTHTHTTHTHVHLHFLNSLHSFT